jgi:hypothetical protein
MELGDSSKMPLLIRETTRFNIPEEHSPDTKHTGNLKSHSHLHVPSVFFTFNDHVAVKTNGYLWLYQFMYF